LHFVRTDPGQIEQVIMNLSLNARDAMREGGRLIVETHNALVDDAFCRAHPEATPGSYVQLLVRDTGCGMTPEVRAHLFEPFFTTKGPGKGTGLGLATVYGIIEQNGGFITVQSQVAAGTTFELFIPTATDGADEGSGPTISRSMPAAPTVSPGDETILLVEDEQAVRQFARVALEVHGYKVLEAANGPRALELIDSHPAEIDILVTDVVMPEMSGGKLAATLRTRFPQLKVLFISGYNEDALVRRDPSDLTDRLLQKPFTSQSLATNVRALLDQTA